MNTSHMPKNFLNATHQTRFLKLIEEDDTSSSDRERFQLFYVISGSDELYQIRKEIYNTDEHSLIYNPQKTHLHHHTANILQRSIHLYNSFHKDLPTYTLMQGLDSHNTQLVVNSFMIYVGCY